MNGVNGQPLDRVKYIPFITEGGISGCACANVQAVANLQASWSFAPKTIVARRIVDDAVRYNGAGEHTDWNAA